MKPYVVCHMISSLDGALHASRWSKSADGSRADWSDAYERIHQTLAGDAWIVGRVTMAEMSKAAAHAPADPGTVARPHHFAVRNASSYAIAIDPSSKLHFSRPDIGGDPVVVLLGHGVPDSHLAELTADKVSYLISATPDLDLAAMLDGLCRELGIRRLLLEGGATINGSFFAAGLVDELSLLVAPTLDGRAGAQSFVEFGNTGLSEKVKLSLISCETLDHGLLHLRYAVGPG